MSNWVIALGAVIVLGIGTTAWIVLLRRYAGAGPSVELDAIRTAGTLVVGTGGFAALLLAARRQQSTERTLEHQREVARATERDAAEQHLTELYTRAVDQLGNSQAPVRLGGLHALERLAQNNPGQRQTIVDVICAYLRMPYTPPDDLVPGEDASEDAHSRYEQRRQQLQVRLTAQRILTTHLRPEADAAFWGDDIDLNLTEAHLHQLDLTRCHVRRAQFGGATFAGDARFEGATFVEEAGFDGAKFARHALFSLAEFLKEVKFDAAEFAGIAEFKAARFAGDAGFRSEFARGAMFSEAEFLAEVEFAGAEFAGYTEFGETKFTHARFSKAKFAGDTRFFGAEFVGDMRFDGVSFTETADFAGAKLTERPGLSRHVVLPTGWTTRAAQPAEGEEEGWLYVVRDEESSEQPTEANDGSSDRV